ncbi:DsrE family protein [uncultured Brevundimonas sp.]|uniref:DsrE family protein n=1 Tax=uncultured Brevundimonas sp. TaxID=213418 RepID=UPI0030EC5CA6|tara:strand:+ start:92093 stop:92635 length:543 start_codon:yes stop_codon:yes gene_type:complete
MLKLLPIVAALLLLPLQAAAEPRAGFHTGPVFTTFGHIASVQSDLPIPEGTVFRVVFDVTDKATPGQLNRTIDSAARFINMHVEAGVPVADIHVAIVVHGGAAADLLTPSVYAARNDGATNGSAAAIAELTAHGVDIWLCGQTAAAQQITKADLLPGVGLSLSAMTALALLQQQGYTLNP